MLLNPERGFRHEIDAGCDVGPAADARWAQTLADVATYNLTVVQTYCYLVPENETDVQAQLSPAALGKAAEAFARLRMAGAKALLRFAYDRDMPGTHRYSARTILGHVEQLQPVLALNSDALYVLQAGFIGSWGEWHSEAADIHGNATAVTEIVEAELFTLLPPDRKLNVRVPVYKLSGALRRRMGGDGGPRQNLTCDPGTAGRQECRGAYGGINASACQALGCCFSHCGGCPECYAGYTFARPIEQVADRMAYGVATESKSNTAVARIGFDNDGFMSTSTDGGTWGPQYASRAVQFHPHGESIRFRLALRAYAPWGVRVVSQTKSRKIPTRNVLPFFFEQVRRQRGSGGALRRQGLQHERRRPLLRHVHPGTQVPGQLGQAQA